jgi:hypothetical protein
MRIYIESTIPSYVVARPSRDSIKAMRQQLTKDWWERKRLEHELFTSETVLEEIGYGELEMAQKRLSLVAGITLLPVTAQTEALTRHFLESGILPSDADSDAAHIALATIYKMDILLTWNCKHIANPFIQSALRRLTMDFGRELPELRTPDDLLEAL